MAGIKIGKDLAPIVKGAAILATTMIGGPALAISTGMTGTTAAVITSAAANCAVTGLSGADESQVTKATLIGAGTACISGIANSSTSLIQSTTTQIIGNTSISLASGDNLPNSIVKGITSSIPVIAPNNMVANYSSNAISGAILNDNPLRGALQGVGSTVSSNIINNAISEQKTKNDISEKPKLDDISQKTKLEANDKEKSEVNNIKRCNEDKIKELDVNNKSKTDNPNFSESQNWSNEEVCNRELLNNNDLQMNLRGSANISTNGISVSLNNKDDPLALNVSNKSFGITGKHSETTKTSFNGGITDIYKTGFYIEKKITIETANKKSEIVPISTDIYSKSITNNGECYSTRQIITETATANGLNPVISTKHANQIHINGECIKNVGIGAVVVGSTLVAPEIAIPLITTQQLTTQ